MPFEYFGGKEISLKSIQKEIQTIENVEDHSSGLNLTGCRVYYWQDNQEGFVDIGNSIGFGLEGEVYQTQWPNFVVKIYFPEMRTRVREDKLKLMVENWISDNRLRWPLGLIYSDTGHREFLGVLMHYAKGKEISAEEGAISLSNFFRQDRRNLLTTLINVASIFELLEQNMVVMGDVNFSNFLIDPETYGVTMIDLDGAQVSKYPCATCKENFNAPELFEGETDPEASETLIANQHYHQRYSTFDRDRFSLASYLFMMMMCTPPFAAKGATRVQNLAKRCFGFSLTDEKFTLFYRHDDHSARWSHLPHFVRQAFMISFTTSDPSCRPSPTKWREILECYRWMLDEGYLKQFDKDCTVLYDFRGKSLPYSELEKIKNNMIYAFEGTGFTFHEAIQSLLKAAEERIENFNIDEARLEEDIKRHPIVSLDEKAKVEVLLNIGVLKRLSLAATCSSFINHISGKYVVFP